MARRALIVNRKSNGEIPLPAENTPGSPFPSSPATTAPS